jgi:hypothetical protein
MRTSRCLETFGSNYPVTHSYHAEERNSQVSCSTKHRGFLDQLSSFLSNECSLQLVVYSTATETEVRTAATKEGVMGKAGLYRGLPQTAVFLQFTLFKNWCGNSLYIK